MSTFTRRPDVALRMTVLIPISVPEVIRNATLRERRFCASRRGIVVSATGDLKRLISKFLFDISSLESRIN